jgi:hypothetical protein
MGLNLFYFSGLTCVYLASKIIALLVQLLTTAWLVKEITLIRSAHTIYLQVIMLTILMTVWTNRLRRTLFYQTN